MLDDIGFGQRNGRSRLACCTHNHGTSRPPAMDIVIPWRVHGICGAAGLGSHKSVAVDGVTILSA